MDERKRHLRSISATVTPAEPGGYATLQVQVPGDALIWRLGETTGRDEAVDMVAWFIRDNAQDLARALVDEALAPDPEGGGSGG